MCNIPNANSTEIENETNDPIIDLLPEQDGVSDLGGSLRLGANTIDIQENSMAYELSLIHI